MRKIIVLIILLLLLGYYTNVKYKENELEKNNDIVLITNDGLINHNQLDGSNKENHRTKIESDKLIFEKEVVSVKYATRCGFNVENIDNVKDMLTSKIFIDSISEKQDYAINKLIDGCFDWYDYLAGKDEVYKSLLKNKMRSKNNKMEKFSYGEASNSSILLARENIKNEDPDIASIALNHSLNYDMELRDYILDKINFKDGNYFSNNSMQIAALYNCELSRDCGLVDSETTLISCLINKSSCGLSVYDSMYTQYSPSQIAEMKNILGIIMQKIKLDD